jgi:hypothetical protein
MSPKEPLTIVNTDRIDGDQLVVVYSDNTTAVYNTEQLAELTPTVLVHEDDVPKD